MRNICVNKKNVPNYAFYVKSRAVALIIIMTMKLKQ